MRLRLALHFNTTAYRLEYFLERAVTAALPDGRKTREERSEQNEAKYFLIDQGDEITFQEVDAALYANAIAFRKEGD